MRFYQKFIVSISFALACSATFASQQAEDLKPEIDLENGVINNIEVITITGRRPLGSYRRALRLAEKELYKEYSKLTDIDEFKISCSNEQKKLDSRLKEQICKPRFEKTFVTQETQFQISRLGTSLNNSFRPVDGVGGTGGGVSVTGTLSSLTNLQNVSRGQVGGKLRQKREAHYNDMLEKVLENPELADKLVKYAVAKQKYDLRNKQRKAKK